MNDFRVHAESSDVGKIEGLIKEGFYIYNSMLVMELNLNEYAGHENLSLEAFEACTNKDGSFQIEAYDPSDLKEYLKANSLGFDGEDNSETIFEEMTYENAKIYVIRHNKKIVSSVTVWNHSEDTVSTENIFTLPKYREKHLASKILDYVLNEAKKDGIKKARLTVYGDDVEAIYMYQKFGYKLTKVLQELRPLK